VDTVVGGDHLGRLFADHDRSGVGIAAGDIRYNAGIRHPWTRHPDHWLRNDLTAAEYLHGLARGDVPLTHDALHYLPS